MRIHLTFHGDNKGAGSRKTVFLNFPAPNGALLSCCTTTRALEVAEKAPFV